MKAIFCIFLVLSLCTAGCNDKSSYRSGKQADKRPLYQPDDTITLSADTLTLGDIFITIGPAGSTHQKEGKIVIITDSGQVLPVIIKNDKLMAMKLTGDRIYNVNKEGDYVTYSLPDSNNSIGRGRMLLLTDDDDILEVRLLGSQMVVLTENNMMIPLVKK